MQKTPLILLLALCASPAGMAQFYNDYELEPHGYFSRDAKDPTTLLMKRIQRGEVLIKEANGKPLVERFLKELNLEVRKIIRRNMPDAETSGLVALYRDQYEKVVQRRD